MWPCSTRNRLQILQRSMRYGNKYLRAGILIPCVERATDWDEHAALFSTQRQQERMVRSCQTEIRAIEDEAPKLRRFCQAKVSRAQNNDQA